MSARRSVRVVGIRAACVLAASVMAASILAPAMAQAEGFYTHDLGDGGAPDACMFRAQRTLNALRMQPGNGGSIVSSGTWSVDAYNLQPGGVDVQIACPYRDSHVSVTLVIAHSDGPESERMAVVNSIIDGWNAAGQAGDVTGPAGK